MKKRILFIFRSSPYGNLVAQEGLDALFTACVFEQDVAVLFIDDGVYQLINDQQQDQRGNLAKQIKSLPMYDVDSVSVCRDSLSERGLSSFPLCIEHHCLSSSDVYQLMNNQDHILTF